MFFTLSVLFSWQALHLCPQIHIVKCFALAKREIMCYCTLWNISLRSMWNEINPLTPAGISLADSEFHARSAFHKSHKGFISLRSVLNGTALGAVLLRTLLRYNRIHYLPTGRGRRVTKTPRPFFFASTAFVVTNADSEIFCFAKCEIMFCRTLWNISLLSMWNEINPLTPAGISLAESEFHARSAFHKSRKGFISLRSVLKGTALKATAFSYQPFAFRHASRSQPEKEVFALCLPEGHREYPRRAQLWI